MIKLFVLLLFLSPGVLSAACTPKAIVYYINGVNNPSKLKVRDDALLMGRRIKDHSTISGAVVKADALYNKSSGIFYDVLYEFATQRATESASSMTEALVTFGMAALGHVGYLSDTDRETAVEFVRKLELSVVPDSVQEDLFEFEQEVRNSALMKGMQVILVAHSQGNMFANKVYENINRSLEQRYARGLGVLNVASPSAFSPNYQYLTLEEDRVIAMLRSASGPLPRPVDANYSSPAVIDLDYLGHNFAAVYLSYSQITSYLGRPATSVPIVRVLVQKIDSLIYQTSTFFDAPNYIFDSSGNRVPRPEGYPADSALEMVCFPDRIGGSS